MAQQVRAHENPSLNHQCQLKKLNMAMCVPAALSTAAGRGSRPLGPACCQPHSRLSERQAQQNTGDASAGCCHVLGTSTYVCTTHTVQNT